MLAVMDDSPPWLTGQLLLALPGVGDPRFDRAVIAMVNHGPDGAMGLAVNRPLPGVAMGDILNQLDIDPGPIAGEPVMEGGPVERQRGFVLHSGDWTSADTVDVADHWKVSMAPEILHALAQGGGPRHWLFILGYAGWDAGQLEEEFARHAWHAAPSSEALLFGLGVDDRWTQAFASVGVDARLISAAGGAA